MPCLVCENCHIYYEIDSKEELAELTTCECGSSLEYYPSLEEYLLREEMELVIDDGELLDELINSYESASSKIILYCVGESPSPLTIDQTILVLRGSRDKSILDNHLDRLNSYSLLPNFSRERLEKYIQTLLEEGFLKGRIPISSSPKMVWNS